MIGLDDFRASGRLLGLARDGLTTRAARRYGERLGRDVGRAVREIRALDVADKAELVTALESADAMRAFAYRIRNRAPALARALELAADAE